MRLLLADRPWDIDASVLPIPWRTVTYDGSLNGGPAWKGAGGRLRIGVIYDDGVVRPVGPIKRALDSCCRKLADRGAEIVEIEVGAAESEEAWDLVVHFARDADGITTDPGSTGCTISTEARSFSPRLRGSRFSR